MRTRHSLKASISEFEPGKPREVLREDVLAAQLSEMLFKQSLRHVRALDVGCGQGAQALLLARAGHEVTGSTPPPSSKQVRNALATAPGGGADEGAHCARSG